MTERHDPMQHPESHHVRDLVYETFATEGRAPSVGELASRTQNQPTRVRTLLRELADVHALVLNTEGDRIRMAHPFTAAPMAFVLTPSTAMTIGAGGVAALGICSG